MSPSSGDSVPCAEDEVSVIKVGLRNLKILRNLVSTRRFRKTTRNYVEEKYNYIHSDGAEFSCDTDSLDDDDDDLDDRERDDDDDDGLGASTVRKSFSYGSLHTMNNLGTLLYAPRIDDGGWVHYSSHEKSDDTYRGEQAPSSSTAGEERVSVPPLRRKKSMLERWRKTKLPKVNKGEPLLKQYGEEGGDDIDYDRRLLTPSDGSLSEGRSKQNGSSSTTGTASIFGDDDNFVVGSWEWKQVLSRDGQWKLSTEAFFASIDQRSERAAGESACTALVAVVADWFLQQQQAPNPDDDAMMPVRSQLDGLIRDGSLEWRKLCENEAYRARFPDKHFDLDTVLRAQIRPITVVPSKSFVGFFHPHHHQTGCSTSSSTAVTTTAEENEKEKEEEVSGLLFDFLDGAMSFDSIWDEISRASESAAETEKRKKEKPSVYIVSWNDHFFVLKVEADAYYIVDTLGERLSEGCNQAYILRFDDRTTIRRVVEADGPDEPGDDDRVKVQKGGGGGSAPSEERPRSSTEQVDGNDGSSGTDDPPVAYAKGKDACKEYIKRFLAAIPIRELQADIKKGLVAASSSSTNTTTLLHHRLQIEFHYAEPLFSSALSDDQVPFFEFCWPEPPPPAAVEVAVSLG